MKFHRSQKLKVRASVDLIPLLNVVFLLILFFILTSTFTAQNTINIQMARAKGPLVIEQKDLSITLQYGPGGPGDKGPIFVNNVSVADMEELSRVLAEAHSERPDIAVLIRPDARVESGRLIEVIGIANSVGIDHYGIATQPPSVENEK